jgi:putative N6-adenine-specific DNA methylase
MSLSLMSHSDIFEIFFATAPGLEPFLRDEVKAAGFHNPKTVKGGVTIEGRWPDVWRANLTLRGASTVLARIGQFRAFHLAQLDKRSRKFPWAEILTQGQSIKVEVVTNRKSKIYHTGAAIERIERAIHEEFGAEIADNRESADTLIKTRIDDNTVHLSVDTSGIGLHKRGHKQAMGKAPLRETMAALLLRGCGYKGHETVLDPMCGSGTFVIEAAEIAQNKMAGRSRSFAFEKLATFNAEAIEAVKQSWQEASTSHQFHGSDRNVKVIGMAQENATRAGIADVCHFSPTPLAKLKRPDGPAGLVIVNPPYGARIGKKRDLYALYKSFGDVMRAEFSGWRVGMVTADSGLAKTTELDWDKVSPPIAHGGLRVKLFQTKPL